MLKDGGELVEVSQSEILGWLEQQKAARPYLLAARETPAAPKFETTATDEGLILSPSPAPAVVSPISQRSYQPLPFQSAREFMLTYCDEFELYPWQIEELERLSGNKNPHVLPTVYEPPTAADPLMFNLAAANGSGKDNVIIAGFILWFLACKTQAQVRATSFTEKQIEHQTFKHCNYFAKKINASPLYGELFDIVNCRIRGIKTDSEALFFVTNEGSRAEGFHAQNGNEFAVIINEAKSIEDDLFNGFSRYTGWNYWIQISSTGEKSGQFYRDCTDPEGLQYPSPIVYGRNWFRRIRATDCPHIMAGKARIKKIEDRDGIDSLLYKSAIESEFSDGIQNEILIKTTATEYTDPPRNEMGLPRRAGLDLSLGGDETVLSIWQGNYRIAQEVCRERYEPTLHFVILEWFKKWELLAENIVGDAGGLGKPIIQRLHESGWEINAFNFGGAARNKGLYLNRGAELGVGLKRVVEAKLIELPRRDYKFLEQLTTRRYSTHNGKIKLESKQDVRARGAPSPDRVDATIMAWSIYDIDEFLGQAKPEAQPTKPTERKIPTFDEAVEIIEARRGSRESLLPIGQYLGRRTDYRRNGFLGKKLGLR